MGEDVTKKLGCVFDLSFKSDALIDAREYEGTVYKDYGMTADQIQVDGNGYLVVAGQKYDVADDRVEPLHLNPANVYDLRLFE